MKTLDLNEHAILSLLYSREPISSEEFFALVPDIRKGGEPARSFAKKIRWLLKHKLIETKRDESSTRIWCISKAGRHLLDLLAKKREHPGNKGG